MPVPAQAGPSPPVEFGLATFNALSLLDRDTSAHSAGLHGSTGRVRMLCASLDAAHVGLAGLQECRTLRGSMRCSGFTRLASGRDEHACFGVELWIRDGSCFDASKAVVLHAEPTFMIVSLPFLGGPLKILVAHGPHRAHSEDTRRRWWGRVTSACDAHARSAPWILLLDGNCRLGSVIAPGVGPWLADVEDLSGELFRELLSRLDCWLPATFSSTAAGHGGTLCLRRNGELVRSDYVALPRSWTFSSCLARVDPAVSSGHGGIDHLAALVYASICVSGARRPRSQGGRIDPLAIAASENRPVIEAILASAPVHAWSIDASLQAAELTDHLYNGLRQAFPLQRRRLRGRHFSDHTAQLRTSVSLLRRSLRTRTVALDVTRKRCAFAAWKQHQPFNDLFRGHWLWQLQIRRALDCLLLRRAGPALRRSCKADRSAYLGELSTQVAQAPCSELHHAVRRIMRPKKFRKKHADPLPLLLKPEGGFCQSHDEIMQVWRDHFRSLEAGLDVDPAALVLTCRGRQARFEGTDCLPAAQLPTWAQLQTAFRTASPHKAHGPDLLPPVLCALFSQKLTELFWPVLLKTVLRSNEPIGLKGGILHRISKPAAVANTTAGYRGILVQSCLSKALHRAARHLAVDHWTQHQLPLQIGGRKGCPAQFGHFCSRAFLAFGRATAQSAAILFVDIAAAYYGVIREALLGPHPEGRPVEALAAALGLTREDLQRLHSYIHDEPILREQSAADLFCEIAGELHRNTWFVLAGDSQVVETHRGTRPGGALADVLFNILFCRVLQRRDAAGSRSGTPLIPWHGHRAPFASSAQDSAKAVVASDVVYADDLASFLLTACASALPRAISSTAADTVDVLLPHGLNANIGPTKTAAVAAPIGRGCRAVRRSLFSEGQGRLVVLPENRGAFRLDLVPSYKHLGSIVSHDGCLMAEIRHRLSAGRTAMQEGKQRLFACKAIPLRRRAVLFRSHVLSAVLAGVGAWPLLNGQEWSLFSGGLVSLTRQLLCLRTEGGFVCTEAQIFAKAGVSSPSALLHLERLRFLGQMVRHGPDSAWALLSWFGAFQQALTAAAGWLLTAVRATCDLSELADSWPKWQALILHSPRRWKALLKRAECWHLLANVQRASLDEFCRDVWPARTSAPSSPLESCAHACLPCRVAFVSRQRWGAHAHRVHAYHSRAHTVATGRRCQACGLTVANAARLRTHLRMSLACVQRIEASDGPLPFTADCSTGHSQAPAHPGIGRAAVGPVRPETHPPLARALVALASRAMVSDQCIYDVVVSFIAPLPVLRATLLEWASGLEPGGLRDAAEDVLLILHPVHLCDRVADAPSPPSYSQVAYAPQLDHPVRAPFGGCGVVLSAGDPAAARAWAQGLSVPFSSVAESSVQQLRSGAFEQVVAACLTFPRPPSDCLPVFAPPSCPYRVLWRTHLWTLELLAALRLALSFARKGYPVCLRFPLPPCALEPLSSWLLGMAHPGQRDCSQASCLTVEFI